MFGDTRTASHILVALTVAVALTATLTAALTSAVAFADASAAAPPASPQPAPAPIAPVLDVDFADPFILPVAGGLVAYATNTRRAGTLLKVQTSHSPDGIHWSPPTEALRATPNWARTGSPDIWAPEVLHLGSHYILYFSARHATRRRDHDLTLCVGAAVANRPQGPFRALPAPLTCGGRDGVIDASPLSDGGKLWLYMKTDGNCCHKRVRFLVGRLSADGLRLQGALAPIKGLTNDRAWEGHVIEAPEMHKHAGHYTMFFAGGDYGDAHYAIGYARCAGPRGRCTQAGEKPILASRPGLNGPGHQCVFDWHGRSWMAFAAWRTGPPRYRAMYIVPLAWRAGVPQPAIDDAAGR